MRVVGALRRKEEHVKPILWEGGLSCRLPQHSLASVPEDRIFVSESGIRNAQDVGLLCRRGTNAVLIGETLMRSPDKGAFLRELAGSCLQSR